MQIKKYKFDIPFSDINTIYVMLSYKKYYKLYAIIYLKFVFFRVSLCTAYKIKLKIFILCSKKKS